VNNTRDPTKDGQTDVDQEVSTTSALQENTQRRQDDGEDDLADVTVIESVMMFTRKRPEPEIVGARAVEIAFQASVPPERQLTRQ
jgi:hypothetical protein